MESPSLILCYILKLSRGFGYEQIGEMEWTCVSRRGEARRRYVCFIIWVECHSRWGWDKKAMILFLQFQLFFLNTFKLASGKHNMPLVGTTFYSPLTSSFHALKVQLVKEHRRHRCATSQHTLTQPHAKAQRTGRRSS